MSCRSLSVYSIVSLMIVALSPSPASAETAQPLYQDATQPIPKRVDDLLQRMTLEEKVAQLQTIWEKRQALESASGEFVATEAEAILGKGIGQVARPAENKDQISSNKTPEQTARFVNAIQGWLLNNTRLGIPAIFHDEALHGHAARDATSFPQAIAMASTFNPELVREMYAIAAAEIRRRGGTQALTPILDVARDPRWGRIEETMGEDPYLVAALGVAGVQGFQGMQKGVIPRDKVIATLKHLAGHGEPVGGLNIAPTPVGERALREVFLFPFEAAVKVAGARSVMASYNEIDGVPSHANGKMLRDILRDEWGFDGVLVSDYFAINELITRHHLTDKKSEAARIALEAGVDLEMPDGDAYPELTELVKSGQLDVSLINEAVARILHEKFMLGLFEDPYVELEGLANFIGNAEHVAVAQKAAEQAIILLKNDKNLLPLNLQKLKSVAVIGPHVHETLLGGYSDVPRETISVLQGIKDYVGDRAKVNYAQGTLITVESWQPNADSVAANTRSKERWNINEVQLATPTDTKGMIKKAAQVAKKSDVAIVVVGENEAVSREGWSEEHLGDRTDLTLLGEQQALVEAVLATGTPTVVVLQNGRPLAISSIAEQAPAIIEAWYLGQNTGAALARVLFGEVNPSGKLPLSIPRSVGHIPVYYNHKPAAKRGYAFSETSALFPFGHGLSYTDFSYKDVKIDGSNAKAGGDVRISFTLTNTGKVAGTETVQLYIHDKVASLTRPVKELKGFKRVTLAPGKSAQVSFDVPINLLGFYDTRMRYIVEPGTMEVMLGSSSEDIRLQSAFDISGKTTDVSKNKAFLTTAQAKPL